MTTTYIRWPKSIDAEFRARYLAATGEHIQEHPLESEDGTEYMVGSWRITKEHRDALRADAAIEGRKFSPAWPEDWRGKQDGVDDTP